MLQIKWDKDRFKNEILMLNHLLKGYILSQESTIYIVETNYDEVSKYASPEGRAKRMFEYIRYGAYNPESQDFVWVYKMIEEFVEARRNEMENSDDDGLLGVSVFDSELFNELYEEFSHLKIPISGLLDAIKFVDSLREESKAHEMLLNSFLISSVAQFENYIRKIFYYLYNNNHKLLSEKEKNYSLDDINAFNDFPSFYESFISKKIDNLMRNDVSEWSKFFCRAAESKLVWFDDYIFEIFKRRNALVHTDGMVNGDYKKFINASKLQGKFPSEEFSSLSVDIKYLRYALNKLARASILIAFSCFSLIIKRSNAENRNYFGLPNVSFGIEDITHELVREGRRDVVLGLYPEVKDYIYSSSVREVIRVNSLCALQKVEDPKKFKQIVQTWDVSALNEVYHLVKYCLLEEFEIAEDLFYRLIENKKISYYEVATWESMTGFREYLIKKNM